MKRDLGLGRHRARSRDARPQLDGDVDADVARDRRRHRRHHDRAAARRRPGSRVVLLEAGRLAGGVSGYTTAKVSSQHGLIYDAAALAARRRRRRAPTARRTRPRWRGSPRASSATGSTATSAAAPSYAYVAPSDRAEVEREAEAAIDGGPARLAGGADAAAVPRRGGGALRRPGRVPPAQVPARARRGSARPRSSSARTRSRSTTTSRCTVKTPGRARDRRPRRGRDALPVPRPLARVRARAPAALLRDRLPHRRRAAARACTSAATRPRARSAPCRSDGEELLLVGGEGHKTGTGGDTERALRALEAFAREHWDVRSVEYRWSAQDNTTLDLLPYVGRMTPVQRPRADGDRLRQVGHDGRHRRGAAAGRPRCSAARTRGRRCSTPTASSRAPPPCASSRRTRRSALHFVGDRLDQARHPADRGPRAGRGRHRRARRRAGRRPPRRRRHAASPSPRAARTSAARSTGTPPSAAGTAPATARASAPRARAAGPGRPPARAQAARLSDAGVDPANRAGVGSRHAEDRRGSRPVDQRCAPGARARGAARERPARRRAAARAPRRRQRHDARLDARAGRAGLVRGAARVGLVRDPAWRRAPDRGAPRRVR